MFMPGIPQVWYLDLFAGKNDYAAADNAGTAGHKEINRTPLTKEDVEAGLQRKVVRDQLAIMRLRNTSPAFRGELTIGSTEECRLQLTWKNGACTATLDADLRDFGFRVTHTDDGGSGEVLAFSAHQQTH